MSAQRRLNRNTRRQARVRSEGLLRFRMMYEPLPILRGVSILVVLLSAYGASAQGTFTYHEDFHFGFPGGWEIVDGGGDGNTWSAHDPGDRDLLASSHVSVDSALAGPGVIMDEQLLTSSFDFATATSVTFECRIAYQSSNFEDFITIDVQAGGGNWTTLYQRIPTDGALFEDHLTLDATSAIAGQSGVRFRFYYHNAEDELYFAVDDVRITAQLTDSGHIYNPIRAWPALPQSWYFGDPTSLVVDSQNNTYVLDSDANVETPHLIKKFGPDGQFITQWAVGDQIGRLAIDRSDNIYMRTVNYGGAPLSIISKGYRVFSGNGEVLKEWVLADSDPRAPSFDLAFDDAGNIYNIPSPSLVQIYTNDFEPISEFVTNDGTTIALDSQRQIYIGSDETIQKYSSEGTLLAEWPGPGREALVDQTIYVSQVRVFDDSLLYAQYRTFSPLAELNTDPWVRVFSLDGQLVDEFDLTDARISLSSISLDSAGSLVFVKRGGGGNDYGEEVPGGVERRTPRGEPLEFWGSTGTLPGDFYEPRLVATDSAGNVYVGDSTLHRIQKFDGKGVYQTSWPTGGETIPGAGTGEILALDTSPDNHIYALIGRGTGIHGVRKFSLDGDLNAEWEVNGRPRGLAVDNAGDIYVSSFSLVNDVIQKFSPNGQLILEWDHPYSAGPILKSGPDGFIYTVQLDPGDRVAKFTTEGVLVQSFATSVEEVGCYYGFFDLAVDKDGNIYVSKRECGHVIEIFSASGGKIGEIQAELASTVAGGLAIHINADGSQSLYVADIGNARVLKYSIGSELNNAKAVVVAGGGPYRGNNLWDATQSTANLAYSVLKSQGFSEDRIRYLSHDVDLDQDGHGQPDVYDIPTVENLDEAITEWASDADELVICLIDHGGNGVFQLSGTELLRADWLDDWVGLFQASDSTKADGPKRTILVYDACQSGSFENTLKGDQRVVITSTGSDQNAHFLNAGAVSFSSFFWSQVFNGAPIQTAFDFAKTSIGLQLNNENTEVQTPQLLAMPDELDEELNVLTIGTGTVIVGEKPEVKSFNAKWDGASTATFNAVVTDGDAPDEAVRDGIVDVWVVVSPPDWEPPSQDNPISNLPTVDLLPDPGNGDTAWTATSDIFTTPGTYRLTVYARDGSRNTTAPVVDSLVVDNPLLRRAVLVGSYTPTSPVGESAVVGNMDLATKALLTQGYRIIENEEDDIEYLSTTNASTFHEKTAIWNNVRDALIFESGTTRDLLLYLVGQGKDGGFQLDDQVLYPTDLASWLADVQKDLTETGVITVVLDFDGAGVFANILNAAKASNHTIQVASTNGGVASFRNQGLISFSQYFWSAILNGATVGQAYTNTNIALYDMRFNQFPQINDNGNTVFNEDFDGIFSNSYRLGMGVLLAGAAPIIGGIELIPEELSARGESTVIRALGVTSTSGIHDVFATIVPPAPSDPLVPFEIISLAGIDATTFEGTTAPLNRIGKYEVTALAVDTDNQLSLPKRATIRQLGAPGDPDEFEEDDEPLQGHFVGIGAAARTHNFHVDGDKDWVIFDADADPGHMDPITIETFDLGPGADTVIDVYFEGDLAENNFDVEATMEVAHNDNAGGVTCGSERRSRHVFYAEREGLYFVRVTQRPGSPCVTGPGYGPYTYYDLRIFREVGVCSGLQIPATMIVTVKGVGLSQLDPGKKVTLTLEGPTEPNPIEFDPSSSDEITFPQIPGLDDGDYTITIEAPGFETEQRDVSGLPCGDIYILADGSGSDDDAIALTPMPVPTDVNATPGTGDGTVNLSWTAVDDATSYRIFYSPSTAGSPASGADVGNVTSQTISQLTPGTSYRFQIVAVTPSGESLLSESDSATATGGGPVPPDPPCTGCNCPTKSAIEFLRLSIHEEVLPYDIESVEGATIGANQAIAVRVLSGVAVQPDTVWISVEGSRGYAAVDNAWRPTTPGDHRDGWIVFEPTTAYANGERLFVSAGARYEDGTEFGPVTYVFDVDASKAEASLDPYIDETEIDEPMPNTLAQPVSVAYDLGPIGVFAEPMTVRLPVPEGYTPDELAIYYYSDSERHLGWYPATGVVGFLAEGSRQTIIIDHMTYIEFTVHHGGRVQLGIPIQTQLATLAPLFVALLLAGIFQFTWKRRRTFTKGLERRKRV